MNPFTRRVKNTEILVLLAGGLAALSLGLYIYYQSQSVVAPDNTAATITIDQTEKALYQMSARQKAASLLMFHVAGTDQSHFTEFVSMYQPGGIILMSDNTSADIQQVRQLTDAIQSQASPFPLFIATDQEGCKVARLPQDTYPCASQLSGAPASATESAFDSRSKLLHQAGINLNFGIVADISNDPESFIYSRVFGHDAEAVGQHVAAAVKGSQPDVWSTLKHFPGHGATTSDSHAVIPRVQTAVSDWRSHEAIPFKRGITAGAEAVMFGHLAFTQVDNLPASLSPEWHQMLKEELGFDGLHVTDDMIMLQQSGESNYQDIVSNVVAAINAGNHIVLVVNDHNVEEQPLTDVNIDALLDGIEMAISDGRINTNHLDELVLETLRWREKLGKTQNP